MSRKTMLSTWTNEEKKAHLVSYADTWARKEGVCAKGIVPTRFGEDSKRDSLWVEATCV